MTASARASASEPAADRSSGSCRDGGANRDHSARLCGQPLGQSLLQRIVDRIAGVGAITTGGDGENVETLGYCGPLGGRPPSVGPKVADEVGADDPSPIWVRLQAVVLPFPLVLSGERTADGPVHVTRSAEAADDCNANGEWLA
jgi:hypothetical protein